jgi:RNA polymerase sigma-70 factor, ECF subfamily
MPRVWGIFRISFPAKVRGGPLKCFENIRKPPGRRGAFSGVFSYAGKNATAEKILCCKEWGKKKSGLGSGVALMEEKILAEELSRNLNRNFERLVEAYQDRIYSFALRLTNHAQDGEDIAQEGFVRAYRALKTYPAERIRSMELKPWLYRIVLNVFRNRRRGFRPAILPLRETDAYPGTEGGREADPSPQALLEGSERRQQLTQALSSLPGKYRTPVILRHVEGLTYGEMSEILGQPAGTLKSNVHRGLQLLRKAWVRKVKEGER